MRNWLYQPAEKQDCFDSMEKAAEMVINKDKSYPKEQFTGIGAIAKAVYANRIFPFRYKRLFKARLGQLMGGAISHSGILLVYQGHVKRFTWNQITTCKVNITTIIGGDPNTRKYSYTIELGFGDEESFTMNPNGVNFFEFGGRGNFKLAQQADADDEKVAELFAIYYNRIRSERAGLLLTKGKHKIPLHYPINAEYSNEISRRFNSSNGLFFKKKFSFKRLAFTKKNITFYKGMRKRVEAIIDWHDIANISVALGASYSLWIISYKEGVAYTHEFIWPNSWHPDPPMNMDSSAIEKQQRQMILPLCWLEMHSSS
jgi:hypothetical protein